jgi:hypothetical protein
MTEVIDAIQMKIGYDKFIALRLRQKEANLKYRLTEHGKAKTTEMHRNWVAKRKNDVEYIAYTNLKARERYHIRKAQKIAEKETVFEENTDIVESLGEIEIQQFPAMSSSSLTETFDIAETAGDLNENDNLVEEFVINYS